jgi:hypothetical protein
MYKQSVEDWLKVDILNYDPLDFWMRLPGHFAVVLSWRFYLCHTFPAVLCVSELWFSYIRCTFLTLPAELYVLNPLVVSEALEKVWDQFCCQLDIFPYTIAAFIQCMT